MGGMPTFFARKADARIGAVKGLFGSRHDRLRNAIQAATKLRPFGLLTLPAEREADAALVETPNIAKTNYFTPRSMPFFALMLPIWSFSQHSFFPRTYAKARHRESVSQAA